MTQARSRPATPLHYERLAAELLRHLRGKRSQMAFSRRLGYSSNAAHSWERAKRFPTASTFLSIAAKGHPGCREAIVQFGGRPDAVPLEQFPRRASVASLLRALKGGMQIGELAAAIGGNRATVSRWLKGTGEPRLPDFLRLIQASTQRLLEFVAIFAPPETLPSIRKAWDDLQAQLRVAYDLPWSHAVLRLLETQSYRRLGSQDRGYIAKKLGISEQEATHCLEALARAKQIRRTKRGWRVAHILTVDTARDPDANRKLKAHWAHVGIERLRGGSDGLFSYNLFAVSGPDYERLQALHADYFERMRAIISSSQGSERVVLTNLQLIPLA